MNNMNVKIANLTHYENAVYFNVYSGEDMYTFPFGPHRFHYVCVCKPVVRVPGGAMHPLEMLVDPLRKFPNRPLGLPFCSPEEGKLEFLFDFQKTFFCLLMLAT